MVIWAGWGILVPIISLIIFILGDSIISAITKNADYTSLHNWPFMVFFIISGIVTWFLGKRLNKPDGKVYVEKGTENEVIIKKNHSLFFIKMEYWGPILGIIGIIYLFFAK